MDLGIPQQHVPIALSWFPGAPAGELPDPLAQLPRVFDDDEGRGQARLLVVLLHQPRRERA